MGGEAWNGVLKATSCYGVLMILFFVAAPLPFAFIFLNLESGSFQHLLSACPASSPDDVDTDQSFHLPLWH